MRKGGHNRAVDEEPQARLKEVMRLFPQGVTVVTTEADRGPMGITVSSFISVSLDPPLVLVSLARGSNLYEPFIRARSFAVNFLAEDQKSISDLFAGKVDAKERFGGLKFHRGISGSPIIDGVCAAIECKVWRVYQGGDHSIIIGEVMKASVMNGGRPLVYYAQRYTTIREPELPATASGIIG